MRLFTGSDGAWGWEARMMASLSTTHPSPHTDHDPSSRRLSHVRWVFPASVMLPLGRDQVVGRDESCDSVLLGNEISRRHATFRVDGPVVAVRDLSSRNGVFVNGLRRTDTPLQLGDVVRCGEWIGVLVSEPADSGGFMEIAPGWFGGFKLATALESARRIATDLPIIVQGETGTGKEGVARAIHGWSGRRGPLVAVNCAALPAELAEAELFGHRKGAFTSADTSSLGLFRAAEGGSLFLDEILELPLALQAKLLRVLEDRRVRAVGETREIAIDIRVIVATQESLADAVTEKRFRGDLHGRLDGLTVVLPPLRARREDIVPLFVELLRQHAGGRSPELEAKLMEALCLYDWPLNVRELALLARRLIAVHGGDQTLKRAHLPERMLARAPAPDAASGDDPPAASKKRSWKRIDDEEEFETLLAAVRNHGGSVAKAAAAMGVKRSRVYRLLYAHDISPDTLRAKSK